jgi:hypothetical protein
MGVELALEMLCMSNVPRFEGRSCSSQSGTFFLPVAWLDNETLFAGHVGRQAFSFRHHDVPCVLIAMRELC